MRFLMTLFLWLLTTVLLAAAVPSAWAQKNVIDVAGYSAFAEAAAKDPQLQQAVAGELATQVSTLVRDNGGEVNADMVRGTANAYTAGRTSPASSPVPTRSPTRGCSPTASGATRVAAGSSTWHPCWPTRPLRTPCRTSMSQCPRRSRCRSPQSRRPAWSPVGCGRWPRGSVGECRDDRPGRSVRSADVGHRAVAR